MRNLLGCWNKRNWWLLLVLLGLAISGCKDQATTGPNLSPEERERQRKQLQEHRKKEWGNQ